jgi:hypothetical protein
VQFDPLVPVDPYILGLPLGLTVGTGTPAFEHAQGIQMFDYLSRHPEETQIFADGMRGHSVRTGAALSDTYDFSSIGSLADIGGAMD